MIVGAARENKEAQVMISSLTCVCWKQYNRFNAVVGSSFAVAIGLVVIMTLFPYLTFGGASKSFILNNYATSVSFAFLDLGGPFGLP